MTTFTLESAARVSFSGSAKSQPATSEAASAPASCATMNAGTSAGRMPAKLSVSARATVTAGLANEVEEVNQ